MSDNSFDYVIVGGGTAGCLLANRLSLGGRKRVLLIEAGRRDDYHWIHIPVGYLYCIGNPRTDWLYNTEPDTGLNGRALRYPRGKTLGGCSSINGMIYTRGQARDYDQWARLTGDEAWGWKNSLPDFMAHESHYRLDGVSATQVPDALKQFKQLHGAGGEWRVEKQRLRWDVLDAFAQAAQQAGIPASDDFNQGDNEGVGYFEVNQKNGWRWNTAKAFLRPTCYGRPNFEMWTAAQVAKLVLTPQTGIDGLLKTSTGSRLITAHGNVVELRIDNSPLHKKIDEHVLLFGSDETLRLGSIERQDTVVEIAHILNERNLEMQAGFADLPLDLAELENQRVLTLIHGK